MIKKDLMISTLLFKIVLLLIRMFHRKEKLIYISPPFFHKILTMHNVNISFSLVLSLHYITKIQNTLKFYTNIKYECSKNINKQLLNYVSIKCKQNINCKHFIKKINENK